MNQPNDPTSYHLKRCSDCRVLNRSDATICQACHGQNFEEMQSETDFFPTPPQNDLTPAGPQPSVVEIISEIHLSPNSPVLDEDKTETDAAKPSGNSTMSWLLAILFMMAAALLISQPGGRDFQNGNPFLIYWVLLVVAALLTCRSISGFFSNLLLILATLVFVSVGLLIAGTIAFLAMCFDFINALN